ncbi:MAG: hypothetical protein GSR82_05025 [Desulfurococcales archaeon]|nr:hypothetical protein [Desulfurococcales archaeon]MEB3773024.1 hypothetical protein [Desulfurococcales archaeon]MEB3799359.1 hypothetical protein [Desulfurococcales archaeon]
MKRRISDYMSREDRLEHSTDLDELKNIVLSSTKAIIDELEKLRKQVSELESACRSAQASQSRGAGSFTGRESRGKNSNAIVEYIKSMVQSKGYVTIQELLSQFKVKPRQLVSLARNSGFKIIEGGGDYIITSIPTLVELENRLSGSHTTDVNEAEKRSGDLSGLFEVLRRYGLVYYDARIKGWRIEID